MIIHNNWLIRTIDGDKEITEEYVFDGETFGEGKTYFTFSVVYYTNFPAECGARVRDIHLSDGVTRDDLIKFLKKSKTTKNATIYINVNRYTKGHFHETSSYAVAEYVNGKITTGVDYNATIAMLVRTY